VIYALDKNTSPYYISTHLFRVLTIYKQKYKEIVMSKLKIKPLGDRIVVKPMEAEEKTKGGIILPDTVKEKPVEGTIVAAGPGRKSDDGKTVEMEVKVGEKILYGKYSGTEVTIEGEEYLIMRESDIFAIV
jgi:chaperonin GroES